MFACVQLQCLQVMKPLLCENWPRGSSHNSHHEIYMSGSSGTFSVHLITNQCGGAVVTDGQLRMEDAELSKLENEIEEIMGTGGGATDAEPVVEKKLKREDFSFDITVRGCKYFQVRDVP